MALVLMATHGWGTLWSGPSNLVADVGGQASFTNPADATAATHYADAAGASPSTGPVTADANGRLMRYIAEGIYNQTLPGGAVLEVQAVSGATVVSVESDVARIPWVNVTKPIGIYAGATGLSGADDTAAIHRARDLLPVATPSSPGTPVVNNSGGGILYFPGKVGVGVYDCASSLNFSEMENVTLLGDSYGGNFYNGAPASRLRTTAAGGVSRFVDFRTSYGCAIIGLAISHSNSAFNGTLLDLGRVSVVGGQGSADFYAAHCYIAGNPPYQASLALGIDADLLLDSTFFKCFFHGLDRAIKGLADIPANRWSNTIRLLSCTFSAMANVPILNPGGAWVIRDCTFQQLANGQAGAVESQAGIYAQALVIDGNYMGDAGLAVTGVAATNLLTAGGHGLVAGDQTGFLNLTGGAGLSALTRYFVIASGLTATTFKVSATLGGAEVDFTTDITAGQVQGGTWVDVEAKGLELGGNWMSAGARAVNLSGGVVEGVKTGGNLFHYTPTGIDLGSNVGYMNIKGDSWDNVTSKIVATNMAGLAAAGIFDSGHPSYPFWWTQTDAYTNLSSAGDSNLQVISRGTNRPALIVGIQGVASTPFGVLQAQDDITQRELRLNPNGGAVKFGAGNHGFYGVTPVARAAAITAPTAPGAAYVQAEAAAMKTAVDAIRTALANIGITS